MREPDADPPAAPSPIRGGIALTFAGWFVLLGAWSLATPPMASPDEPAHVVWAAAAARGQWAPSDMVTVDPATGLRRTESQVRLPEAYGALAGVPVCHAGAPEQSAVCAPPVPDAAGEATTVTTTAGRYLPLWYALVGWPSLVMDPPAAVVGMRLTNAALVAALLTLAVTALRRTRAGPLTRAGALVAVTPVLLHTASTVNPSGVEIAAALALAVATLELLTRGGVDRRAAVGFAAAGSALALARPIGAVWALAVPAVVALAVADTPTLRALLRRPSVRRAGAAVLGAVVLGLGWVLARDTLGALSGIPDPDATGLAAVRESLARTPDRVAQLVSVLGWADVVLPRWLVLGWLALPAVGTAAALAVGRRRTALVILAVGAASLAAPVVAEWRSASATGFAWQGRYHLPLALLVPVLAGYALDVRHASTAMRPWSLAVAAGWVAGQALALGTLLGRYEVGAPAGWPDVLTGGRWEPAVPDGLLGIAALVGALAAVSCLAARRRAAGPVGPGAARSPRPAS